MKTAPATKEIGKQTAVTVGAINSSPTTKVPTKVNGPTIKSMVVVAGPALMAHSLKESGCKVTESKDSLSPSMEKKSTLGSGRMTSDMVLVYNTVLVFASMKVAGKMICSMDRGLVSGLMAVGMMVNGKMEIEVVKEGILPLLE
jgi:hypothetical protein